MYPVSNFDSQPSIPLWIICTPVWNALQCIWTQHFQDSAERRYTQSHPASASEYEKESEFCIKGTITSVAIYKHKGQSMITWYKHSNSTIPPSFLWNRIQGHFHIITIILTRAILRQRVFMIRTPWVLSQWGGQQLRQPQQLPLGCNHSSQSPTAHMGML